MSPVSPSSINIITVKTGTAYSPDYVLKMRNMLQRHLDIPFDFHCITEDPSGLSEDIEIIKPLEVFCSWWDKLTLFSGLVPKGPILYLDLDQIILGNITDIVEECFQYPFACYSDHIEYCGEKLGTAFMTFQGHAHLDIYNTWYPKRHELLDYSGGDQVYISRLNLLPEIFYWNHKWNKAVQSYKYDLLPTGKPPGEAIKIINFHGRPKMHEVRLIPWIKENWV